MTFSSVNRPEKVYLYNCPAAENLHLDGIRDYLSHCLRDADIIVRDRFLTHHLPGDKVDETAVRLASAKVRDISNPYHTFEPLKGEIEFEKRLLREPEKKAFGIMYDGHKLLCSMNILLPEDELKPGIWHIVFTNRLVGTFDNNDRRFHARVIICGFPAIVSTTGVVEAPAKPREYYLMRRMSNNNAAAMEEIKSRLEGKFIRHDDSRMTEVLKGYALQAVFFYLIGDPFCEDAKCRLYNAHWQHELITAQLESGKLCERHMRILESLRN